LRSVTHRAGAALGATAAIVLLTAATSTTTTETVTQPAQTVTRPAKTVTEPAQTQTVTRTETTTIQRTSTVQTTPTTATKSSGGIPSWGWALIGAGAVLLVVAIFMIGRTRGARSRDTTAAGAPSRPPDSELPPRGPPEDPI